MQFDQTKDIQGVSIALLCVCRGGWCGVYGWTECVRSALGVRWGLGRRKMQREDEFPSPCPGAEVFSPSTGFGLIGYLPLGLQG